MYDMNIFPDSPGIDRYIIYQKMSTYAVGVEFLLIRHVYIHTRKWHIKYWSMTPTVHAQ